MVTSLGYPQHRPILYHQVGNDKNLAGKRNAPRAVIPAQRRCAEPEK